MIGSTQKFKYKVSTATVHIQSFWLGILMENVAMVLIKTSAEAQ